MKTTFLPILLLGLCLVSHLKAEDDVPNPPLISVTGSGEVKVKPDEVEVSVGIQLRDQDVNMLSQLVDRRSSAIIKILEDEGVDEEDIETSNVSIQPYYASTSSSYGSTPPDYYTGTKSVTFVLKNITNYDTIMTQLYNASISSVDSVTFQLSDALLNETQFEARKKAAANAKQILNTLVDGLGLDIGKAYYVSESTTGGAPVPIPYDNYSYGAANAAVEVEQEESSGSSSSPSISGGEVTITSTVSAQYYLV